MVLVCSSLSCGSSDGPDGAPALVNSIVFVSNRTGMEQIYVMNADGTNVRQLTTMDGGKNWPTVSPDGRKIAFGVGDLVASNSTSIYTMNSDGTELTQLTHASGWNYKPSWSPEGERLAFVSTRDGNSEIYTIRTDGSGEVNISNNPNADYGVAWRPVGSSILFVSDRAAPGNPSVQIYSMTPDGDSPTPLTFGVQPEWAPSGGRFLFKNDGIVWVSLTPDGTSIRQLLSNAHPYITPTWSPDESAWAFSWQSSAHEEIFESSDTSGLSGTQLTPDNQGDSYYPSWTRR
jgi:TolB protein